MTATTQTVREIALEQPSSIRVFEQFRVDYCCGGRKPLSEACTAGNLEVDAVLAALEAAAQAPAENTENWAGKSLGDLSSHIVATHHAYVKRELPRLALPRGIENWSLTSLQQRLVKTGGRLVKHARYYWLLLAEGHLTRRRFGAMLGRIALLPVPTG